MIKKAPTNLIDDLKRADCNGKTACEIVAKNNTAVDTSTSKATIIVSFLMERKKETESSDTGKKGRQFLLYRQRDPYITLLKVIDHKKERN